MSFVWRVFGSKIVIISCEEGDWRGCWRGCWVFQRHGVLGEPAVRCVLGLHWMIDEFEPHVERGEELAVAPTSLNQGRGESGVSAE